MQTLPGTAGDEAMTTLTAPRKRKPRRGCQYVVNGERCGKHPTWMHWSTPAWRCEAHRDAEACCVAVSEARVEVRRRNVQQTPVSVVRSVRL